jgi:putative methyltransferase (TIGR04325 family)
MAISIWPSAWRRKDAADEIAGYDNAELVGTVVRRTAALLNVPRIDDVVPGEILAPTLLAVAMAGADIAHVVDFGGAAGLHYLAAKQAFPMRRFRWAIVETPAMVEAATLGNDDLRFFTDIEDAASWLERIDIMHSNSALQYVDEPDAALDKLLGLQAPIMLWGKMMLAERREHFTQRSRLRENGPGFAPEGLIDRDVTYRATRVARADFLNAHIGRGYRLAWKTRETETYLFARP